MTDNFTIAGESTPPGSHQVVRIPVTVDLDGGEIALWVHVLAGVQPGPTLVLTGIQHGDEWQELELFRRVVRDTDPTKLAGNLLVLPVCSPTALGRLTRITQVSSDGPDLNRVFPGKFNWVPEQIAKTISREILPKADALIDFHFGIWGSGIGFIAYGSDYPNPQVAERSRQMALAFGHPIINHGRFVGEFPGPSSMLGYAGAQLEIPGLAGEIGVVGFGPEIEEHWLRVNEKGVRNVMHHLGMLEGEPETAKRVFIFEAHHRVEPTKGGLLVPAREPDELGREVKQGELLARVLSPYTFEELERLEAPSDGILTLMARTYPVQPGDWAFGVADTSAPSSEWVEL
jgi:predicted deacylase